MSLSESPCLFLRRLGVDDLDTPKIALNKRQIKAYVAQRHGLTVADLDGDARRRDVAWVRQESMWMMRQVKRPDGTWRYSLPEIGWAHGGRDHTTALHGIRRHQARLDAAMVEMVSA